MIRDNGGSVPNAEPDDKVVPLLQEEMQIEKRQVSTGKVRIRTIVDLVDEIASATLSEEQVSVTRVPVGQVVTEVPAVRTENGITIIPVLEEVLVIEKQLVLREELHIRRDVTTETVEVPVTLRRQRADVERFETPGHPTENEEIEK